MILPIFAYGDPVLKSTGKEIDANYEGLQQLIKDMFETMYEAHGVGLAAPQIGKSIRLFIVDASPFAEDDEKNKNLLNFKKVFINPIILEETGTEWSFNEGCLSIPGIREDVSRKSDLRLTYYDQEFNFHDERFEGLAARVIQHEYDHVEGVLFIDRIHPLKKRLLKGKLMNISKGDVKADYRMKFPLKKNR